MNLASDAQRIPIDFRWHDVTQGLPDRYDVIVSNPPYVPDGDRPRMQPEVREHEPAAALYAGPDGLAVVRALVPQAVGRLAASGYLVFEIGIGQADAVDRLISATAGLTMVAVRNDLQGIPRTVIARRTS